MAQPKRPVFLLWINKRGRSDSRARDRASGIRESENGGALAPAEPALVRAERGGAEDVDLAEPLIDQVDAAVLVDVHARGQHVVRRAVLLGALADEHEEIAFRREQLEVAERSVDHVDVAVAVGGDLL